MTDRAELPSVLANLTAAAEKVDAELRLERDLRAVGLLGFVRGREFAFAAARTRRRFRFDFSDVDRHLAIEVQGGGWMRPDEDGNKRGAHGTGAHIERDCEKTNLAAALGWTVLCVTPAQIKKGQAITWIEIVVARLDGESDDLEMRQKWEARMSRAFAVRNSSAAWGIAPAGPTTESAPVVARVMG
ncbi:MAG TPA: hypothetical protein DCQ64_25435 [Candidatus Rokubacteria bacterium]|nr:hypothetical protein [Candidatus Rokubacteria bacterium]